MPIASSIVAGLIIGGATAGAQIYGAKKASGAANTAAKLQTDASNRSAELTKQAADESLAFQKDMWNTGQQNAAPYLAMGRSALGGLNRITGLDGGGGQEFHASPSMWNPSTHGSYVPPNLVSMKAPDGSVQQVPRAMVPHYQARGAQVVNA